MSSPGFEEAGFGTMSNEPIYIGTHTGPGGNPPFGINPEDALRHIYIIGKTGSGKSTLIRNMVLQLLEQGHGFALIDPHGDLADDLMDHFPSHRTEHLIFFDPSDTEFPVGMNPLAGVPRDRQATVADGLVDAFKSIWWESWGPRMELILKHSIRALMESENTSLMGINRMLTDAAYRERIVSNVQDLETRRYWTHEFPGYNPRQIPEYILPIQNKIGQLTMHPALRNILSQVDARMNFRFVMDNGRAFIANLSKGKIGPGAADLLGALLVTQFQLAAMSRSDLPKTDRRPFFLIIDEFHNFTTQAFEKILAEVRKYGLSLTISHQYLAQLRDKFPPSAIFGNVGTVVSFQLGYNDAEVLEKEFGKTFIASQFADLDKYEIFVRLLQHGRQCEPFRGNSLPPLKAKKSKRDRLIQRSRLKYATPRQAVEDGLEHWMFGEPDTGESLRAKRRRRMLK